MNWKTKCKLQELPAEMKGRVEKMEIETWYIIRKEKKSEMNGSTVSSGFIQHVSPHLRVPNFHNSLDLLHLPRTESSMARTTKPA